MIFVHSLFNGLQPRLAVLLAMQAGYFIRLYPKKMIMQLNDLLRLHFVVHQSCSGAMLLLYASFNLKIFIPML